MAWTDGDDPYPLPALLSAYRTPAGCRGAVAVAAGTPGRESVPDRRPARRSRRVPRDRADWIPISCPRIVTDEVFEPLDGSRSTTANGAPRRAEPAVAVRAWSNAVPAVSAPTATRCVAVTAAGTAITTAATTTHCAPAARTVAVPNATSAPTRSMSSCSTRSNRRSSNQTCYSPRTHRRPHRPDPRGPAARRRTHPPRPQGRGCRGGEAAAGRPLPNRTDRARRNPAAYRPRPTPARPPGPKRSPEPHEPPLQARPLSNEDRLRSVGDHRRRQLPHATSPETEEAPRSTINWKSNEEWGLDLATSGDYELAVDTLVPRAKPIRVQLLASPSAKINIRAAINS